MKFKKIKEKASSNLQIAVEIDGVWNLIENSESDLLFYLSKTEAEIKANYGLKTFHPNDFQDVLPFQPSAYRDFMLYEQHAIEAGKGFVKKYMPGLYPVLTFYEKLTGKTFPKLKPSKRYYQYPIYYLGNHLNFITDGDPIAIPSYTAELDYELELAAVIIKPLKNAKKEEVNDAIGGFVILNDFSARDVQLDELKAGFGPMKAKNFGNAISAVVVGKDEILEQIDRLQAKVLVNDQLVAQNTTANKLFSFQEAIAYASWEEQLHPGELFGSGTIPRCTGIENGVMLKKGDTIRLEVEKMGSLCNFIV